MNVQIKICGAILLYCSIIFTTNATQYYVVKGNTRPMHCTFTEADYCEYDTAHIWIAKDSINGEKSTKIYNWVISGNRLFSDEHYEDTIYNKSEIYYNVGAANVLCHTGGWMVFVRVLDNNFTYASANDTFQWGSSTVIGSYICPPKAHIDNSSHKTTFCQNECVTFLDKSEHYPTRWLWQIWHGGRVTDTANTKDFYYCFADSGEYVVDLDVWNAEGYDRDAYILDSQIIVKPGNIITSDKHQTIHLENSITTELEACANGEQYAWFPKENLSCDTCPNTSSTANENTAYYCIVSNENGCTDTCFYNIELPFDLFVPNTFTPNGDGNNDVFEIKGKNIAIIEIRIFDSWGNEIYQRDNTKSWDGSNAGIPSGQGVYGYFITYKNLQTNELIQKSGAVLLLR